MVTDRMGTSVNAGRFVRRLILSLCLCLFAASAVAANPEPTARELSTASTLLKSLTSERSADPELVVRKLVERGEAVVPALVVAGRKLRRSEHLAAIVAVLRRLDKSALRAYLLEFVAKQEDGRATNAAWVHLAEAGDATSIPVVMTLMDGNPFYLKRVAERTLTRLLVRNDTYETWAVVGDRIGTLSEETRMRVALSIGESDSGGGLDLLAKLLGRWSAIDHAVVSAIAQMPEAGRGEEIAARLRPYLDNPDAGIRRETVTALAVFGDVESASRLIENLSGDNGGIRGNSHWALMQLSGLKFPESPDRWRVWHEEETTWWEAEGIDLYDTLTRGSELQIVEALRTIASHPLYRMKFSPLIRKLLEHPSPAVRDAAEETLVLLGLMEGRRGPEATTSLAAHGFEPITQEEYGRARSTPAGARSANATGGSRILPIVAILVLLALLGRLFGAALLKKLGSFWGGGESRKGPMVLTIHGKKDEARR